MRMRRDFWSPPLAVQKMGPMAKKFSFKEILEEASKSVPGLHTADGRLNLTAVAKYYERRGHPVSQPTLHRLYKGEHKTLSRDTLEATHLVFRIPRAILRGEPMRPEMEDLLADYKLSTLLLAQKIESLPKEFRDAINAQVEAYLDQREQLSRAFQGNVTPIDKSRR